jgi:hypothetical protein
LLVMSIFNIKMLTGYRIKNKKNTQIRDVI